MNKLFISLAISYSILFSNEPLKDSNFEKTLRLNMTYDFHQKDPRKVADLSSSSIHFLLHEGLMKMTPSSSSPALAIAKSVSMDSEGIIYTFILEDRYYSTGEKITAYDFERSWKEALDPRFNCPNIHLFFGIKNAKKAKSGLVPLSEVGVLALDDNHLQVHLEHPLKAFLEIISFSTFIPYKNESSFSGPFSIESFVIQDYLKLTHNPYYPVLNPGLEKIEITFIKDEMTAFSLFEKGHLDLIGTPFTHIPKEVKENQKDLNIISQPNSGICFLIFNDRNIILNDSVLRKDVLERIDRTKLTNDVLSCGEKGYKFIIPSSICQNHIHQNFIKKEKLRVQSSPLRMIYPQTGSYSKIAQYLEQELLEKWNLKITLQGLEPKLYLQKILNRDFDLALYTSFSQYRDPLSSLDRFYSDQDPKNYIKFDSSDFRKKIDEANHEIDEAKRTRKLLEAESLLLDSGLIIPLFETSTNFCYKSSIEGLQVNVSGGFNLDQVTKKKSQP